MQLLGLLSLLTFTANAVATALPGLREDQRVLSGPPLFGNYDGVSRDETTLFEYVQSPNIPKHSLRIKQTERLCDSVKQYSGYLDVKPGKHFFFWYFEARHDPENAPLVMWINGGPGCSSTGGLLWELGPCRVQPGGNSTEPNPHSWTEHANMIFFDQPVQAGFSYSDSGLPSTPLNAASASADTHAFLQLFFSRFPKLASKPFHIAGESWGGQFIPHMAATIHQRNLAVENADNAEWKQINLKSILMGNGLTDALHQFPKLAEYLCEGPYAILAPDSKECHDLAQTAMRCQKMVQACYDYNNPLVCMPAEQVCWRMMQPVVAANLNHYDLRKPCSNEEREHLCYDEIAHQEVFLNKPEVQTALGVGPMKFQECNTKIAIAYQAQGGAVRDTVHLLPDLINAGIRVLAYAGTTDAVCNFMGVESFVEHLGTAFQDEFADAKPQSWVVGNRTAGYVRAAGGDGTTAGNQTFVAVYEAGHMAPLDQPEATLDMFKKWINDQPISN